MSADFTPIIPDPPAQPSKGSYTDLSPFRFWCQKVLPLVYDESLSYYEVLCKLVDYLNKTMEDVGVLHDDVDNMFDSFQALTNWTDQQIDAVVTAYGELQSYVNNYFDNLDVQTEINNKLDAMASAGTLTNLLSPFVPDAVASWLAAHVDPETGYVIDNTLTISGAAADAKAAGDKIRDIEVELGDCFYTQTAESRALNIDLPASSGDVFYWTVTEWEGPEASAFTLRGYNALTEEWDLFSTSSPSNVTNYAVISGVDASYTRLRVSADSDPVSSSVKFSAIVKKIPGPGLIGSVFSDILNKTFGSKNIDRNIAARFTQFSPVDFDASNPMSPTDLPDNSYVCATGAVLAGFNNNLFTLSETPLHYAICLVNQRGTNFKQYMVFSRGYSAVYIGYTNDSGATINWKDITPKNSYNDVGNFVYSNTAAMRQIDLPFEVKAGDFVYIRLLEWTGDPYNFVSVMGRKNNQSTVLGRIYETSNNFMEEFYIEEDFDNLRIFVNTSEVPETPETITVMACKENEWPIVQMFERSPLDHKYVSILGASYSTFAGYIPEGYSSYYPYTGSAYDGSGVNCVTNVYHTWWMRMIKALNMQLLVNNSSSGSYVTTGHGSDSMAGCGDRCISLDKDGQVPDVIVVQLGGNDFNYEVPLGNYDGSQETFPTDTSKFREAYAIMLKKIMTAYPYATVITTTITNHENNFQYESFPERNDSGVLLKTYNDAIKEISDLFGVPCVDLCACGITYQNLRYMCQDYNSQSGYAMHPNKWGQGLMANAILENLDPSSKHRFKKKLY